MSKLLKTMPQNNKLKIAYVLDDGLDVPNGVQQYILSIGEWMRSQGNDVHYIVGQTSRRDIKNIHSLSKNIKVKFNGNVGTMPLPVSASKIKQLLHDEQFDILHVQMPYSPFYAHKIIKHAPKSTIVVGSFHIAPNSAVVTFANSMLGIWLKSSLKRFDKFLSVSESASDFAMKTFKINSQISPNVVDYSLFNQAKPFSEYQDNKLNILFLGRLVQRKGCMQLLKAINQIKNIDVPFRVLICGKGPLLSELQTYVNDNDITDLVEFKGYVTEEEKLRYYKSADIAVFPSSGGESFGIVLLEAMCSGNTAVLAGDNSGYRAVLGVKPEVLFNPSDTNELAEKLMKLLVNQEYRNSLANWGHEYVKNYDINFIGPKLFDIYNNSLQKS